MNDHASIILAASIWTVETGRLRRLLGHQSGSTIIRSYLGQRAQGARHSGLRDQKRGRSVWNGVQDIARPCVLTGTKKPEGCEDERWQVCLGVARNLLLVEDDGSNLREQYQGILIDEALPRTTSPRRILIIGAGISGLAAGHLLKRPATTCA